MIFFNVKLSYCKGNEPDCNKVADVKILEKLLKMPVFDNTYRCDGDKRVHHII